MQEKKKNLFIGDMEEILSLLQNGEIVGPFDEQWIHKGDFLFSGSGIERMFKEAETIRTRKGYDFIYNPSFSNSWFLGVGAKGYFEFYRFNTFPGTIYRGRLV